MSVYHPEARPRLGFIGQGWVGKHFADEFENRGFDVTRYAKGEPYEQNEDLIPFCDIVSIAVPTPTTPDGFDYSIVRKVLKLVGNGKTALIKSTVLPDVIEKLQDLFPDIYVLSSPEFLREVSAAEDVAHPERNIVGIPLDSPRYYEKAQQVLSILPEAPFNEIMSSREAALVKYFGNVYLMNKVLMMNTFYDVTLAAGGSWDAVRNALIHDPRIGESHTQPVGRDKKRGAGGHCFPKDFEAFTRYVAKMLGDTSALSMLEAMRDYNLLLLQDSGKDLDIIVDIYGDAVVSPAGQTVQ